MDILRTPDERFADLPGYPFAPHYVDVGGVRIHYLDEGPAADAPAAAAGPVLLLHGEPSWSYLYRTMIPVLTAAGLRAVAPDLVGFGRSDKPAAQSDYTYQRHVDWMRGFLDATELTDITLFCQDWGGLIGLRLVAEHPDRFARVITANTFLPTGDRRPPDAFLAWQQYAKTTPELHVGGIIQRATTTQLSDEIIAAYDAPFPDDSYKAGARVFPALVPTAPDDPASEPNRRAWKVLEQWTKPWLTAFSDQDPITRGADAVFHKLIPGAQGQPHTTIEGGGHFLQEDRGPEIARVIVDFVRATGA
ncbi:haloalkane dehalogenase [Haliangium sp.]|uniref:haloalkane dehalogenase n=1 Tax=Haliangium sp. TaxID=2663208 RepID=UPI003D0A90EA